MSAASPAEPAGPVEPGVDHPLGATPDRVPGSVRRSSHVDVLRDRHIALQGVESQGVVMHGVARDIVTGAGGAGEVVAEATMVASLDAAMRIAGITTDPPLPGLSGLVGRPAGRGFRAAARSLGVDPAHPLALLLDDVPVAALISGYGSLREGLFGDAGNVGAGMRDLCSGWRTDGVMMRALDGGAGLPIPGLAAAPDLTRPDDPLAIEPASPLPPGALRRQRRIDAGAGWFEATFRDTHADRDGRIGTLHQYVVRGRFDGSGAIVALTAEPRVLPWPECPAAAGFVSALVGRPLAGLASDAPTVLAGTSSCTHLNDLLRSLAVVPALAAGLTHFGPAH